MDLLTNALSSIKLGVEDFQAGSTDRRFSVVRNIHAGVLLLYKEALHRKSPPDSDDVLVKARVLPKLRPSGELVFVGHGTKTVEIFQIVVRLLGCRSMYLLPYFQRLHGMISRYIQNMLYVAG